VEESTEDTAENGEKKVKKPSCDIKITRGLKNAVKSRGIACCFVSYFVSYALEKSVKIVYFHISECKILHIGSKEKRAITRFYVIAPIFKNGA
jgi:hypothetical protein